MIPHRDLWPWQNAWMRFLERTHADAFNQYKCRLHINARVARYRQPRKGQRKPSTLTIPLRRKRRARNEVW